MLPPQPLPAIVGPPVTGDGYELKQKLHAGQLVEDLSRLPVETHRPELKQELHHLHYLLVCVRARLRRSPPGTQINNERNARTQINNGHNTLIV